MPKYYPLLMNIEGRDVLVIGGGEIAARKVKLLLDYGSRVTVVAREIGTTMNEFAQNPRVSLQHRAFVTGDLDQKWLVVAATNDRQLHEAIKLECDARRLPCNVVDVPDLCSFIVPSIIRRGELMVTISTDGLCPAYSKFQRQRLERCCFPEGSEALLHVIAEARGELKGNLGTGMSDEEKFEVLRELAESDLVDIIATHGEHKAAEEAKRRVHLLVGSKRK